MCVWIVTKKHGDQSPPFGVGDIRISTFFLNYYNYTPIEKNASSNIQVCIRRY